MILIQNNLSIPHTQHVPTASSALNQPTWPSAPTGQGEPPMQIDKNQIYNAAAEWTSTERERQWGHVQHCSNLSFSGVKSLTITFPKATPVAD